MNEIWVTWNRSKTAHLAGLGVTRNDVRSGAFPLECGRWAPDGWDAVVEIDPYKRRCQQCARTHRDVAQS